MKRIIKFLIKLIVFLIILSILWVLLYKWVNPPISTMMIHRNLQNDKNVFYQSKSEWVEIEKISPNIILMVIASEDNNFFMHNGFEWESIIEAREGNKTENTKRGGSTISQQCAKNCFLWPHKHYFRKGLELWFTFLIETFWGKDRILEVYLNVIETGNEIYGVQNACKEYYNIPCTKVSKNNAAFIAAILPNPLKWNAVKPGPYVRKRQKWILRNSNNIYPDIKPWLDEIKSKGK